MGNSWGHAVLPLTADERAHVFTVREDRPSWMGHYTDEEWAAYEQEMLALRRRCSRNCPNDVAHVTTYRYVTGRAGRVSWADKKVCAEHAKRFAEKHQLELPPIDADPGDVPEHAGTTLFREVGGWAEGFADA